MKKFLLRITVYLLMFVVFVGGVGALGYSRSLADFYGSVYEKDLPNLQGVHIPEHDPTKPTAVVVLGDGSTTTEIFDFLIPYNLLSRTEAYNVYAVAPDKKMKSLSGGLEVVPHYSYDELDALLGKSPDLIVVPFIPIADEAQYQPVREYIQKHKATSLVSICGGSMNLADAGLLHGKSATAHWQGIPGLSRQYPDTVWQANKRYVVEGNIVSSGGQTGGFDAILYTISQKLGEPMAKKIADDVHYPTYHFVANPTVDPYSIDLRFGTYVLNYAFQWNKVQTGVLLYDGMEEMALSSVFDTFADTGTTVVSTISSSERAIVTKYHLNLVARYQIANAPKLKNMYVTGTEATTLATEEVKRWNEQGDPTKLQYLHSDEPNRFVFSKPLEMLAQQEDLLTAEHAVKRFEYRANDLTLEGQPFSYETYGELLLMALLSVMVSYSIDRRFISKKGTTKSNVAA